VELGAAWYGGVAAWRNVLLCVALWRNALLFVAAWRNALRFVAVR